MSVGSTLLIAEFVVRWTVEGSFAGAWRSVGRGGVPVARTGKTDWVIPDPELGYRLNPGQPGPNPLVLRDPSAVGAKKPGRKRLLVIGDSVSYVWGEKAPYQDGWVNLLRTRLERQVEVINGAVPGYTTYQERRYLERDLLALEPDLVILQYCPNDNHRFLHQFDAEAQWLGTEEARRYLVPRENDLFPWLPRNSYLAFRLRLAILTWKEEIGTGQYPWDNSYGFVPAWEDTSWADFEENMSAIQHALGTVGAEFMVAVAPIAAQFDPALHRRDSRYVLKPQTAVASVCERLGVPVLDWFRPMAKQGGFLLFEGDGIHLNSEGHRVAADTNSHETPHRHCRRVSQRTTLA